MSKKKLSQPVEKNDQTPNYAENDTSVYKVRWFDKIPFWIKALFIKYWTCGVLYFFVNMGLGNTLFGSDTSINPIVNVSQYIILSFIGGLIYGLAYYLIEGFLLEIVEFKDGEGRPWVIFYSRKYYAIFIYCVYGIVWAFVAYFVNYLCAFAVEGNSYISWMFREPFTFAVVGLAVEMFFVGIKDLIQYAYRKVTHKEVM